MAFNIAKAINPALLAGSSLRSNSPPKGGLPKGRGRPKIAGGLSWRKDGECDQIIILSKEDFALPLILNSISSRIFLLCNGDNSLEEIAQALCDEFDLGDFSMVLEDVKKQVDEFLAKGIVGI